ncbi:MAG: hypothetical protein L6Q31_07500 [Fimbriimonadaceae bacterium]|uniref:Nucleic acid-binding protein, contains Zn-ribbon domain n=1 Tax=Candidatus Nitrosymbiomonas proteolyticus TaxID=2608984 RepID=A0A809R4L8_9BACT|nr:hypothetical protein [Fimbriimonadaceae bacterium]NUM38947.1 zinc ribbon domain-containing protein [Armatimonadota bacterium]BBO22469.1 nucleic acid-binding protein, contains Zn-ribbon domain [Candidatus Nitrosymbiomonas proteolyticus]HQU19103.1 zinc ribbon domain-containing protein [Fimbriimonadaceae bacterium]
MPTYVYECSSCQQVFEAEQRITDSPLSVCDCGSEGTVKRLIQPAGVVFKGSGFHINDYSSSTQPAQPEAPACSGEPASCPACSPESD